MIIAVASRDGKTVSGHIGKCADWIIYDVSFELDGSAEDASLVPIVQEAERIQLEKAYIFHYFKDDKPHPFEKFKAVIGASAGDSFVSKMAQRGIKAVLTAESNPVEAVTAYAINQLPPPKARPIGQLLCKVHDAISAIK